MVRALRRRVLTRAWWTSSALLLAIALRLLLLSVIHVTSFPAIGIGHLAPAHPLLLVFIVMTLACEASRWTRAARSRR